MPMHFFQHIIPLDNWLIYNFNCDSQKYITIQSLARQTDRLCFKGPVTAKETGIQLDDDSSTLRIASFRADGGIGARATTESLDLCSGLPPSNSICPFSMRGLWRMSGNQFWRSGEILPDGSGLVKITTMRRTAGEKRLVEAAIFWQ